MEWTGALFWSASPFKRTECWGITGPPTAQAALALAFVPYVFLVPDIWRAVRRDALLEGAHGEQGRRIPVHALEMEMKIPRKAKPIRQPRRRVPSFSLVIRQLG